MTLQIKLAEFLPPYPTLLWTLAKQVGVSQEAGIGILALTIPQYARS